MTARSLLTRGPLFAEPPEAQSETVPVGKQQVVHFRFACDKMLRHVVDQVAFLSLRSSEWAGRTTTRSGRAVTPIARPSEHWVRSG